MNGRGSRSAPDGTDGAGGRGRGRGGGGQQYQHQQVPEGQVQVGTPGGLMQLLAGGAVPANGHPPTPHAWNIDNLLGSTFELWDFDLPHHPSGEVPMAAAAVDSVFAAGGVAAGAGGMPLQQRQPIAGGAVPLALAHPVAVAGEAAACHGVPALLLPSGSVGQQWGPSQQHGAAVEQHHLDQLHLQRHHQVRSPAPLCLQCVCQDRSCLRCSIFYICRRGNMREKSLWVWAATKAWRLPCLADSL